jgi:hypothetical protein
MMKDTRKHTYHSNTFGFAIGTTMKTACSKRRPSESIVKPLETDCEECQTAVIASMVEAHEAFQCARKIVMKPEYWSIGLRDIHTGQRVKQAAELYLDSRIASVMVVGG